MDALAKRLGINEKALLESANFAGKYYDPFDIEKPNGALRHIDNPLPALKRIQRRILGRILVRSELPETMFGGLPGRDAIQNAHVHTGRPVVVVLDLKDFFLKIHDKKKIFPVFNKIYQCPGMIAGILTRLTTFQHRLPQGAPTSSYLANLAILKMHDEIKSLCDSFDLKFSIFVDDIAFSGIGADKAINPIIDIIRKFGFSAPNKKQKIMRSNGRINGKGKRGPQIITGIGVNKTVGKPRIYRENLAQRIFELGDEVEIDCREINSLIGKISHVEQISPHHGEHLRSLFEKHIHAAVGHLEKTNAVSKRTRPCKNIRAHTYIMKTIPLPNDSPPIEA